MGKETQCEIVDFTAKDFIEEFFKIRSKTGELINLKFNHAQQKFYDMLKESYGSRPSRFIVLKARQLGISTFTEAFITFMTMFNPNTSSVLLAHQADSASAIFNMTKLYVNELPKSMQPQQKYSNAKEIVFDADENGLKSSIRVMVASDATRGSTYKYAHLSEVAFWEHPEEALLALNQAVPSTDDSLIVIESTANGFNYFYNLWQDAVNGRSDYTPLFFPWYVDPNYSRPYDGFVLTSYEADIKEKFGVLHWYSASEPAVSNVHEILEKYEELSKKYCMECGKPNEWILDDPYWIYYYCNDCKERLEKEEGLKFRRMN